MRRKVLSIDAETNGLWGQAFAIAATLHDFYTGEEEKIFIGRCPIEKTIDPWVKENVIPKMDSIPISHDTYSNLLEDFIKFYMDNKGDAYVVVHMGLPVESKVFLDAHSSGFLGDWDAPYPLIDISAFPEIGTSVDQYNIENDIDIDNIEGGTHNPLYDCRAAAAAFIHLSINKGGY